METQALWVLDGGMGRELARRGAPFRQPEWSALALMEAPQTVREVHQAADWPQQAPAFGGWCSLPDVR